MKRSTLKSGILGILVVLSGAAFGGTGTIKDKADSISSSDNRTFQANIYAKKNGFVAVNIRLIKNQSVLVAIYNSRGRKVFSETVKGYELVLKKYDMSYLPDGRYYVEVSDKDYLSRQWIKKEN